MAKSIYLTDEQYEQIVEAALRCGFRVSRGRGSQLALFVVLASRLAKVEKERDDEKDTTR